MSNLISLCCWHHRLVHEGGWVILGDPEGEVTFRSEFGRELRSKPNPLRGDIRRRTGGITGRDLGDTPPAA